MPFRAPLDRTTTRHGPRFGSRRAAAVSPNTSLCMYCLRPLVMTSRRHSPSTDNAMSVYRTCKRGRERQRDATYKRIVSPFPSSHPDQQESSDRSKLCSIRRSRLYPHIHSQRHRRQLSRLASKSLFRLAIVLLRFRLCFVISFSRFARCRRTDTQADDRRRQR